MLGETEGVLWVKLKAAAAFAMCHPEAGMSLRTEMKCRHPHSPHLTFLTANQPLGQLSKGRT